ncbi:MAG: hypothetical protein RL483_703 [Pseudomonadota bacterium]|jgi:GTP cyclohydrolase I
MNAPEKILSNPLPDVQSNLDTRNLPIQRVGIKGFRHPVLVATAIGPQPSVATIEMGVGLPHHVKGTHMSRFIEVFQNHDKPLEMSSLHSLMRAMLDRLEASDGFIAIELPYFIRKSAPVSGVSSLMDYQAKWQAQRQDGKDRLSLQVVVPVTSLCPCSKNISDYGAHNQRSHVTITVESQQAVTPEQLIRIAESAASCELWGLLKRPDEKYVTERAYDNPKFVEDLVRDMALMLAANPQFTGFTVESENFESIHNHSAYARIDHGSRLQS